MSDNPVSFPVLCECGHYVELPVNDSPPWHFDSRVVKARHRPCPACKGGARKAEHFARNARRMQYKLAKKMRAAARQVPHPDDTPRDTIVLIPIPGDLWAATLSTGERAEHKTPAGAVMTAQAVRLFALCSTHGEDHERETAHDAPPSEPVG